MSTHKRSWGRENTYVEPQRELVVSGNDEAMIPRLNIDQGT